MLKRFFAAPCTRNFFFYSERISLLFFESNAKNKEEEIQPLLFRYFVSFSISS